MTELRALALALASLGAVARAARATGIPLSRARRLLESHPLVAEQARQIVADRLGHDLYIANALTDLERAIARAETG